MKVTVNFRTGLNDRLSDNIYYETDRGIISLLPPCPFNHYIWEIMSIRGDFFDDVEIYLTKDEAEKRIYGLLEPKFRYGK